MIRTAPSIAGSTRSRTRLTCARAAARVFCRRDAKSSGCSVGNIIFMSSVHDRIPWAGRSNYSAAKGGTLMLMKSLAQELGPDKIRVNAVSPGAIMTDINRDAWDNEDSRQELLKLIPYGRVGEPDDVARTVLWLGFRRERLRPRTRALRGWRHDALSELPRRRMREHEREPSSTGFGAPC